MTHQTKKLLIALLVSLGILVAGLAVWNYALKGTDVFKLETHGNGRNQIELSIPNNQIGEARSHEASENSNHYDDLDIDTRSNFTDDDMDSLTDDGMDS